MSSSAGGGGGWGGACRGLSVDGVEGVADRSRTAFSASRADTRSTRLEPGDGLVYDSAQPKPCGGDRMQARW